MKIFAFLLTFIIVRPSLGTEVLLLGGGGEGAKSTTIFDAALKNLAQAQKDLGLSISSSFNGGHSETELILEMNLGSTNLAFTEKNYTSKVDEYVAKINSGQIKPGENLMVILDTHGAEKTADVKTHPISLSDNKSVNDYTRLQGSATSSVDKLEALAKAAKAKGIRLAILDFSCHSGNSLSLANENTCVISASGPNHFAYSTFAELFLIQMKKGRSLEEVFLQTRQIHASPSFPMISTAEGLKVHDEYYSKFEPYLNVTDPTGGSRDKLKPYISKLFKENLLCQRESEYTRLIKLLENLETTQGPFVDMYSSEDLVQSLKELKALQDKYIEKFDKQEFSKLDEIYQITWDSFRIKSIRNKISGQLEPRTENLTENLTVRQILSYSADNLKTVKSYINESKDATQRRNAENVYRRYVKVIEKQKELLAKYPHLKNAQIDWGDLKKEADILNSKAINTSKLANKLYDVRYRELRAQSEQKKDPCRDFIL